MNQGLAPQSLTNQGLAPGLILASKKSSCVILFGGFCSAAVQATRLIDLDVLACGRLYMHKDTASLDLAAGQILADAAFSNSARVKGTHEALTNIYTLTRRSRPPGALPFALVFFP